MRLLKIAAVLVAAAALAGYFAGQAHATLGPRAASLRVWGKLPCNGEVTIRYRVLPGLQVGESRWLITDAGPRACVVTIDPTDARSSRQRCQTAVHEFGHLLGRGHARNPRSVMFWKATRRNVPRACR